VFLRWIPTLSAVAVTLGLGGLWWYYSLSSEEQGRADQLANEYAWRVYRKNLDELTWQQISDIHDRVRRQFES
jgi:hypothetical protein